MLCCVLQFFFNPQFLTLSRTSHFQYLTLQLYCNYHHIIIMFIALSVLFSSVLFCSVLFCSVLSYSVLSYPLLFHSIQLSFFLFLSDLFYSILFGLFCPSLICSFNCPLHFPSLFPLFAPRSVFDFPSTPTAVAFHSISAIRRSTLLKPPEYS